MRATFLLRTAASGTGCPPRRAVRGGSSWDDRGSCRRACDGAATPTSTTGATRAGRCFRRKAGTTIDEAIAFKTRIDAELNAGVFVPGSRVTFAEYAARWIETHPLKEQTRYRYRSILNAHLLRYFGTTSHRREVNRSCSRPTSGRPESARRVKVRI